MKVTKNHAGAFIAFFKQHEDNKEKCDLALMIIDCRDVEKKYKMKKKWKYRTSDIIAMLIIKRYLVLDENDKSIYLQFGDIN